jgi:predicted dienelactone hydrolase
MNDEVRIVLPAQEDFRHIVHLVAGGLAARLDLTYEALEDLQVALDTVLACREDDDDVEVGVTVEVDRLRIGVGPFSAGGLAALDRAGAELGLRRVLDTVCDGVEVTERDGDSWVELTKRTAAPAEATG